MRLKYKRVMLKLSGEVLEGGTDQAFSWETLEGLAERLKDLQQMGAEVAVVIGGGNIWRYRDFKGLNLPRVDSDYMGMMGTLMNALAMAEVLRKKKVKVKILSSLDCPAVGERFTYWKGQQYLKKGYLVICAGGTGHPFFTTDSAAALRALELGCDVLMKATKVDGVYDKDPVKHKNARRFDKITYAEVLKRDLKVMDLTAIALCKEGELPVYVFNSEQKESFKKVVNGVKIGTIIL